MSSSVHGAGRDENRRAPCETYTQTNRLRGGEAVGALPGDERMGAAPAHSLIELTPTDGQRKNTLKPLDRSGRVLVDKLSAGPEPSLA